MPPVAGSGSPHSLGSSWPVRMGALWHRELGWVDEVEYAMLDDEWVGRTPWPDGNAT